MYFTEVYRSFLLIAKLLKLLLELKSLIGMEELICSMSLKRVDVGVNWELQDTFGEKTDGLLSPKNFDSDYEQLELSLFPGMPQ